MNWKKLHWNLLKAATDTVSLLHCMRITLHSFPLLRLSIAQRLFIDVEKFDTAIFPPCWRSWHGRTGYGWAVQRWTESSSRYSAWNAFQRSCKEATSYKYDCIIITSLIFLQKDMSIDKVFWYSANGKSSFKFEDSIFHLNIQKSSSYCIINQFILFKEATGITCDNHTETKHVSAAFLC